MLPATFFLEMAHRVSSAEVRSAAVRRTRSGRASGRLAQEGFFASLREAPARALLLDYDGTLAPLVAERALARPDPGVARALQDVLDAGTTRVAIVSGRALADLEERVRFLVPAPELWGSHGWERRAPDGRVEAPPVSAPLADLLEEVSRWAEERGWSDLFERKPYGFALHERVDPDRFPEARHALLEWWRATLVRRGLTAFAFDGGVEFHPPAARKGSAIETILSELPAGAAVAYLGDDRTDEDAFAALAGRGLAVLVRDRDRPTAADIRLRPPEEVVAFLNRWVRETKDSPGPPPKTPEARGGSA